MKRSDFRGLSILLAVIVSAGLTLFGAAEGWGEQKKKVSYKWAAADAKYTKQYSIDVSADHQIRIFEFHVTFPSDPPKFEGVRVREEQVKGGSDYVDLNGWWWAHGEYVMENGDKIYYWADGIAQTDGTKKSIGTGVKHLGGGTGKFSSIRGTLRDKTSFDPQKGFHEGQSEGEYWMEK